MQGRLDLLVLLASSTQALVWAVTDLLAYSGGVVAVLLLAERFDGIAGWTQPQLTFMLGYATTVGGLQAVFFSYNVSSVSRRIGRGQLDHTLLQPRPILLTFLTEGFSPFGALPIVVPGLGLIFAGAVAATGDMTEHAADTLMFAAKLAVCLVGSVLIVMSTNFAIGSAAFWSPRGAEEISMRAQRLMTLTEFPLDPVPTPVRTVLLSILPAGFVTWFPAGALLGRRGPLAWTATPLVAIATIAVATIIFRKGLRHYERTGSQRYTDFGHRR